jgi:hypothetical protein
MNSSQAVYSGLCKTPALIVSMDYLRPSIDSLRGIPIYPAGHCSGKISGFPESGKPER